MTHADHITPWHPDCAICRAVTDPGIAEPDPHVVEARPWHRGRADPAPARRSLDGACARLRPVGRGCSAGAALVRQGVGMGGPAHDSRTSITGLWLDKLKKETEWRGEGRVVAYRAEACAAKVRALHGHPHGRVGRDLALLDRPRRRPRPDRGGEPPMSESTAEHRGEIAGNAVGRHPRTKCARRSRRATRRAAHRPTASLDAELYEIVRGPASPTLDAGPLHRRAGRGNGCAICWQSLSGRGWEDEDHEDGAKR